MSCSMALQEIILPVGGTLNVGMDFTEALNGATISTQDIEITPSGITVTNDDISTDGTTVEFTITGGTNGYNYTVKITVTTSESETLVGVGKLKVRD